MFDFLEEKPLHLSKRQNFMTLSYGQTLENFYRLGIAAVGGAL